MQDYQRELRSRVVVSETGCWVWEGPFGRGGYGRHKVPDLETEAAHRASFLMHKGAIPEDKPYVLHTCDNPPCVNPEHLFVGTHQENVNDLMNKGRHRPPKSGSENHGHCPEVKAKLRKSLRKISDDELPNIQQMLDESKTLDEIALHYNVSHTTIYRVVNERMKKE